MRVQQSLFNGPMPDSGLELTDELVLAIGGISWSEATRSLGARGIRSAVSDRLTALGWSNRVRIRSSHGITITAMSRRIGLCLQTGNMARFYADLMKLELVFIDDLADGALYVVPTKRAARELGSNIASYERVIAEAELFGRIITVPLMVLGFEDGEGT
jgi:hypothetical protein